MRYENTIAIEGEDLQKHEGRCHVQRQVTLAGAWTDSSLLGNGLVEHGSEEQ